MRTARCRCGQLSAACEGEPIRVSVCHCFACQQRSGSAFAAQARFPVDKVAITGESTAWTRIADSGDPVHYHFCPTCGATVWYQGGPIPDSIAIPLGLFCDLDFPQPRFSVWERRKHPWVTVEGEGIARSD